jgi:sugar lactone lactonase YvrE
MADMAASDIRCVHVADALLGEGPTWVAAQRALFWLDIHGRRIHRYEPESGATSSWEAPYRIGSLAHRRGGGFVGGSERGFVLLDESLSKFELIGNPEPDLPDNRFNDGKVDLQGRFWAGTMDDVEVASTGALYRLDRDLTWSREDHGYAVTNGPTFSPDGRYLYHTDSAAQTVFRFDLEEPGGALRNKQVFIRFGEADGYPDGMTTDAEGCLWIAFWHGWCLRRISPGGEVLREIELPVQRPTSCAFGGEQLDRLFVTSARVGISDEELARQPLAGGLFELDTGTRGIAAPDFAG